MHLRGEANWKFVLTIPASIMSLFLLLMLVPDVGKRGLGANEERQRFSAAPEGPSAHGHVDPEEGNAGGATGHQD